MADIVAKREIDVFTHFWPELDLICLYNREDFVPSSEDLGNVWACVNNNPRNTFGSVTPRHSLVVITKFNNPFPATHPRGDPSQHPAMSNRMSHHHRRIIIGDSSEYESEL